MWQLKEGTSHSLKAIRGTAFYNTDAQMGCIHILCGSGNVEVMEGGHLCIPKGNPCMRPYVKLLPVLALWILNMDHSDLESFPLPLGKQLYLSAMKDTPSLGQSTGPAKRMENGVDQRLFVMMELETAQALVYQLVQSNLDLLT